MSRRYGKKRKDPLLVEMRKVLLNQLEIDTDGHFKVASEFRLQMWGPADGEEKIRTAGIHRKDLIYSSELSNEKAIEEVRKAVNILGRGINLSSVDNAVACLVKTYVMYPVALVFFINEDNHLQLSLFTARTVSAPMAISLVNGKFDKATRGIVIGLRALEKIEKQKAYMERIEAEEAAAEKDGSSDYESDEDAGYADGYADDYADDYADGYEDDEDITPTPPVKEEKRTSYGLIEDDGEVWDGENWVPKDEYEAEHPELTGKKEHKKHRIIEDDGEIWDGNEWIPKEVYEARQKAKKESEIWDGEKWV